jgi:predicted metal-dependent peptidase
MRAWTRAVRNPMSMPPSPARSPQAQATASLEQALRRAGMMLPHLSGLARMVRISADERVGTAGVFASGRMVVSPDWFLKLSAAEQVFVAAHELLHLALRTHERQGHSDPTLFNVAHDYIINDMLRTALGMAPPAGGLDWYGAASLSAEKIHADLERRRSYGSHTPTEAWAAPAVGSLGRALAGAGVPGASGSGGVRPPGLDALDEDVERRWFPHDDRRQLSRARASIEAAGRRATALGIWRERADKAFAPTPSSTEPGQNAFIEALTSRLRPPWELALQRWLEDVAPGPRSFGRPSRRQGHRADVVLAGRRREGWTLNLVLDTSGSMIDDLSRVLGVIRSFCEAAGVGAVRILQCDVAVQSDETVGVDALARYRIRGGSGSDLTPGLHALARDPEVEAAIVITDGFVSWPEEPVPYAVLWAITGALPDSFHPAYGRILLTPPGD